MNYLEQVKKVPVTVLLSEVWPGSLCLMRDDVWIAFWEHEDEETEYDQGYDESFEDFIWRCVADILENEEPDKDGYTIYQVDFAIAQVKYLESAAQEVAQN